MPLPQDVSEPLRLADGRVVYPDGRVDDGRGSSVSRMAQERQPRRDVKRRHSDLPDAPRVMNAVAVVLAYSLYGLDNDEILHQVKLTMQQVENIKASEQYEHMRDIVVRTVLDGETDAVRELIAQNARQAASVMVDGLNAGSRSDRMAAARDILDRSGHRPADVVEHRHRVDGGLVIEYVKRDETKEAPVIDMGGI